MDKQIKKPQILLPTVVQIKISTNKKVTGKIFGQTKIWQVLFANNSTSKIFEQKNWQGFFPNYSKVKFLDKQKIDKFFANNRRTATQKSTKKKKLLQGVILNSTFVFRLKLENNMRRKKQTL